jgi:hypothetical protein
MKTFFFFAFQSPISDLAKSFADILFDCLVRIYVTFIVSVGSSVRCLSQKQTQSFLAKCVSDRRVSRPLRMVWTVVDAT